ncbi:MAG: hypothetical protein AAF927_31315 [Bacteroidota bacterium]
MKTEVPEIQQSLIDLLKKEFPVLRASKDNEKVFEATGTILAMQGKQKVEGHYFASIMPKPKDVRLYFFPIYTHVDAFADISPELRKFLKGKSCFHIKKLSPEIESEIQGMIRKGVELYQADGLI